MAVEENMKTNRKTRKAPTVPLLAHLQFAVLIVVSRAKFDEWLRGLYIRSKLSKIWGISLDGPKFYQLMRQLERNNYVDGMTVIDHTGGVFTRERYYQLRTPGAEAVEHAKWFYRVYEQKQC